MDIFKHPLWLAALGVWAAALALLVRLERARRSRFLAAFGRPETLARLAPPEIAERRRWKFALQAGGCALLFAALAAPQWGLELIASEATGIQVLFAVDASRSMLAEDISPSRMGKAKSELLLLLDGLKGQRVGLLAFAGKAHLVCPLTTDLDALKGMLDRVAVGMIPQPGTAIGDALRRAADLLGKYPGQKAVILLSDGEDRRGDPEGAARALATAGVRLYVLGLGSPEGGPIPLRDASGAVTGYQKDKGGSTVVTRLAEPALIRLASDAKGAYYRATAGEDEASAILRHLGELDRSKIQGGSANVFKNRYRLPLALAVLLLLAEMLIPERARTGPPEGAPERRRRRPAFAAALAPLAVFAAGCSAPGGVELWRGNRAYGRGDFDAAAGHYGDAARRMPGDARPAFNAGAAEYRRERYDAAAEAFGKIADAPKAPAKLIPESLYNRGNARFRGGDYKSAAEDYKRCLLADPSQEDCRYNLVQALKAQKQPPQKQQPKPKEQPKQDKKDDKSSNPSKPRPQSGQMSQEDAQRILQAVQEKEQSMERQSIQRRSAKPQDEEPDW